MKHYEEKLKLRLMLYRLGVIVLLVLMILIGEMSHRGILLDSRTMTQSARNVSSLIIFGGILLFLVLHHRTSRLLRDRTEQNRQKIRENDERRKYIHDRSNTLTLEVLFVAGILAVLVLFYVNMAAFQTAYYLLLFGMLVKGITYLIYRSRIG